MGNHSLNLFNSHKAPQVNIVNERSDDSKLWVEFYQDAEQSMFQTEEKGYPVFIDKIYCKMTIPGDTQQVSVKEVKGHQGDELKRRFPVQWAAFQQGIEAPIEGYALEHWAGITKSQVETLKAMKFRTVENIADASDSQLQRLMGGFELRVKAKAFLDSAKDSALVQKQAAENERLNQRIADLEAQIARIANDAPKRGRKVTNDTTGNSTDGL
jgi:hypothetical protein